MAVERGGGHRGSHGRRLGRPRLGRFDPTRLSDPAEQPLNMLFRIEFLFGLEVEAVDREVPDRCVAPRLTRAPTI